MPLTITAAVERWPVAGQFIIARGAKDCVDVLVVAVSNGTHIGMGEGTAIYYNDESAESCLAQVMSVAGGLSDMDAPSAKDALQELLPCGAARNALDCALWDVMAKEAGLPLWKLIGQEFGPEALTTAFTISLGDPEVMEADATDAAARGYSLLKLKLTGEGDRQRVAAVHKGAPAARLIVDANESWGNLDIAGEAEALAAHGVEMVEQPVKHGSDDALDGVRAGLPIVADESCHSASDVTKCASYYDGVNIKLDKAGGLTEAMKIADVAGEAGLKIMVGCMLSTSLGIAPAFLIAQRADWVDLDGPALLARDREDGFQFVSGKVINP